MFKHSIITATMLLMAATHAHAFFGNKGMGSECPTKHSKAMCVLKAIGLDANMTDAQRDKVLKSIEAGQDTSGTNGRRPGMTALDVGVDAVGIAANILSPTRGPILGGAGWGIGIGLGLSLLDNKAPFRGPPATGIWMPKSMASSPEEAVAAWKALLDEAVIKALSGYELAPVAMR